MQKIGLVLLLMASGTAQAASFDCTKAKTPQEKAICALQELSAADEKMAAAYRVVLKSVPSEMVEAVREGQRQWLRSVAITCPARKMSFPLNLEECLKEEYQERTYVLQQSIARKDHILFVWRLVTLTAPDDSDEAENDRARGVSSDYGTLNASWPQASTNNPEWEAWNKAIEAAVQEKASDGNRDPSGKWMTEWAVDRDTDVTVKIGFVSQELVTVTLTYWWYGHGAAHRNTDSIQFNWLLKERRELQPEDLFKADSNWNTHLYQRCMHALDPQFEVDNPENQHPSHLDNTVDEIVSNPKNWVLDSAGLAITFPTGSVSCMACLVPDVKIPWKELKPFLKPNFEIPK